MPIIIKYWRGGEGREQEGREGEGAWKFRHMRCMGRLADTED